MSNFKALLILSLRQTLSQFKFSSKKRSGKLAVPIIAAVILLFVLGSMFVTAYGMGEAFNAAGAINSIVTYGLVMSEMLVIIYISMSGSEVLFNSSKSEKLFSLPIKKSEIVFSKLFSLLLLSYALTFLILFPFAVIYLTYVNVTALVLLGILSVFIFSPIITFSVAIIISILVALITSKLAKNSVARSVVTMVLFMAVFILYFITMNSSKLVETIAGDKALINVLIPFKNVIVNLCQGKFEVLSIAYYLSSLGAAAIAIALSYFFFLLISRIKPAVAKSRQLANYKAKSQLAAVFSKEAKKYFKTPMWLVNSGIGPLLFLALPLASLSEQSAQIFTMPMAAIVLCLAGVFCLGIGAPTSCSISLEGKNYILLKTMPVSPLVVIYGKVLFQCALLLPISALSVIIFSIIFNINILISLVIILFLFLFIISSSLFGIIINLLFPKINFTNEVVVIKQSVSMLVTGIVYPLIFLILFVIYFSLLINLIAPIYFILIMIFITIIINIILIYLIKKHAEKLFRRIN